MRHRFPFLVAALAVTLLPLNTAPVEAAAPSLVTPSISLVKWPAKLYKGEALPLRSSSSPRGLDTYVAGRDRRFPSVPVACSTKTTGIGTGSVTGLKVSGGFLYCEVYAKRDATATTTSARSSSEYIKVYSSEPVFKDGDTGTCLSSCSWRDGIATPIILHDGIFCLQWYFTGAYNPNDPMSGWSVNYVRCPQTIRFTQPADRTWDQAKTFTINASSSLGLPLTTRSNTTAICTVSGLTVTMRNIGRCSITASQDGNRDAEPAAPVTRSFNILKGNQAVNPGGPYNPMYVGDTVQLTSTATSGLAVGYLGMANDICTVTATGLVTAVSAGTCSIFIAQGGTTQLNAAWGGVSIPVSRRNQTITFNPPATISTLSPTTLTATATSGLSVTYTTSTPSACRVTANTVQGLVAGASCVLSVTQAGNTMWNAASRTVTVGVGTPSGEIRPT